MTSAKVLADNSWKEKLLTDKISVYNYLKKQKEEKNNTKVFKTNMVTEEQALYLLEHCYIKDGTYNPPVETISGNDEYEAYTFSIDIKGYSKVSAGPIIKKIHEGKKPTQRESIVEEAYNEFKNDSTLKLGDKDFLTNVAKKIAELNKELFSIRRNIQLSKFAIILGNKGKMDEFTSRENMILENIDVKTLTGKTIKVSFQFSIEKVIIEI
jgi:hypothetical protein